MRNEYGWLASFSFESSCGQFTATVPDEPGLIRAIDIRGSDTDEMLTFNLYRKSLGHLVLHYVFDRGDIHWPPSEMGLFGPRRRFASREESIVIPSGESISWMIEAAIPRLIVFATHNLTISSVRACYFDAADQEQSVNVPNRKLIR